MTTPVCSTTTLTTTPLNPDIKKAMDGFMAYRNESKREKFGGIKC